MIRLMIMLEVTFGFVKPDAYGNRQAILEEFILPSGLSVVIAKDPYHFTEEKARAHYEALKDKHFFGSLIQFTLYGLSGLNAERYGKITEALTALYVLEGEDAVKVLDEITGPTDPGVAKLRAAETGRETIRSKYGRGVPDNALHRADSYGFVRREIMLHFTEEERRTFPPHVLEMLEREPYI